MNREFRIKNEQLISDDYGKLQSITYEMKGDDGNMHQKTQEVYDTGNAVAVLLYNKAARTVILGRQLRIATVYNANESGMLTEVCAGKIEDGKSADDTVRKEIMEETGYEVQEIKEVMTLYMSPGAFTEQLRFYIAAYAPDMKKGKGGGRADEQENIEVLELAFDEALNMVKTGAIKDAKTVLLLQYAALNNII